MMIDGSEQAGLVSVAIPVYNGQTHVAESVRSVLSQTYRNIEVIVVDDGSTDGTWEVLQSFGNSIRTIRQPNGGLAAARNAGVRAARGEFIALMDHDDHCEPERIAVQVQFLQQQPEVDLCCSDFSAFNDDGPLASSYIATYYSRCDPQVGGVKALYPRSGFLDIAPSLLEPHELEVVVSTRFGRVYDELALGNFVHPPTVMFRRRALARAGMFEIGARSMCDWDWLVKVARTGAVGFIDRPLLQYRRSDSQLSAGPRALADALHVAHRICERDPSLVERYPSQFRSLFGEMYADAAHANAEKDSWKALALLGTSVLRYGRITRQSPRTLLKILLPSGLLEFLRSGMAGNQRTV